MKKIVLIIMAVMAFAGMSVAQDIYSSGYFTNTDGTFAAAVYKNGSRLQFVSSNSNNHQSTAVDFYNGNYYWTDNCTSPDGTPQYGDVFKNSTRYLSTSEGTQLYDIYRFPNGARTMLSVGCKNISGVKTAVFYSESNNTAQQMGSGSYESVAFGATGYNNYLYSCGYQYTSSSAFHGVIWKGTSVFKNFDSNTQLFGITYFDGYFYTVGSSSESGSIKLKVWKTDANDGTTSVLYTLSTSMSSSYVDHRFSIYIESNDIYVNGMDGSTEKVWKNGAVLYTPTSSYLYAVVANSNGHYYAGDYGDQGKIWKNNSVLYSPSYCDRITDLFIEEPECTNSEVRSLPFYDGFENGNTSWPCWTTVDVDNDNVNLTYWHRSGTRTATMTGDYCARHMGSTSHAQNGWLITPRLFLQPGQSETKMTFKSWVNESFTMGVYVSTDSDPTNIDAYVRVYDQSQGNGTQTNTVDLSAYQGQAVYIAFNYWGLLGTSWLIDEVNVTESFSPCDPSNAPYSCDFHNGFTYWNCWTALDVDMSGDQRCWRYDSDEGCMKHPWGQTGVAQTGWLFSKRITLPTGNYNYTLSFKSMSTSSGTGRKNTVWIAQNESGAPNVSHFTTKIWEDASYSSNWTTYTVDLTAYKGKTVTIGFKYEGTWAHNWFVDDFAITQETAQYTITANANNSSWGTVSGGGQYNAGATCTLTATPASGYQFDSWKKNGSVVSTNPNYSFTVTENATYTAYFAEVPVTYYTITTNVTPSGSGTVTGGGTYPEGASVTLTANANNGYTFSQWQDGNTQNPRTITVTGNATYTATFSQDTYMITTAANPTNGGTVTGGGAYHYGDTPTLTATANSGYEFAGWQDGSTTNPRQITVTGNATYTATFSEVGSTYYTVSAYVSPAGAGTVSGTGTYPAGASVTLTATANSGYTFDHWNDGSTTNPRTITVNNNMSFTAYFNTQEYTIITNVTPAGSGTVTGGGTYPYGATATLTATPNSGYEFLQWSDGSLQNPRVITVTGNATYTALFSNGSGEMYTLTVRSNSVFLGEAYGSGTYPAGSSVEISAYPTAYAHFVKWDDGNTENPRTVVVNSDMEFVAEFAATQNYTITVESADPERGQAFGSGTYREGTEVQIAAVAFGGYMFEKWQDGNTQNPRTIIVNGDATYTAHFVENSVVTYTITLISNTNEGTVSGGGTYLSGATATIQAFPNPGYVFSKWSDENTDNPRTITVNSDLTLAAFFATGVGENEQANLQIYPNPAKESIRILGIEANSQVEIYNSLGELVKVMSVNPDQEIGIRDLASGLYLVRCGNVMLRFVKEQ